MNVFRVKGKRVQALRRYLSEHAKTDAADAYVLGAIPLFGGAPTYPVFILIAQQHALQRLTRQRERLQDELTPINVACSSWCVGLALPWKPCCRNLRTNLALAVLHVLLDPASVSKARRTTLLRFVANTASGNHPHSGPFAEALVDGLKAAAVATKLLRESAVDFALIQVERSTDCA